MPKENAIVALVVGIEPPLVEPAADLLGKRPEGVSVEFEGKQTALVMPGDRAAGMLQILDELRKMEMPAYVEVDPETKAITRLLIPLVVRVAEVAEGAGPQPGHWPEVTDPTPREKFTAHGGNAFTMRETFIREGIGRLKPDFIALMEEQVSGKGSSEAAE